MTLIELLVSTAILAMMILIVNSLLVDSSHTIKVAQATIRANASARALADIMRRDLEKLDPDGFLAITYPANTQCHVIFTTAGNYHSLCRSDARANGARVDFGLTYDPLEADDGGTPGDLSDDLWYRILYRRAILHDPADPDQPTAVADQDHQRLANTYYQFDPHSPADDLASWLFRFTYGTYDFTLHPNGSTAFPVMTCSDRPQFSFPVMRLADLNALWPYVLRDVTEFKVQWTHGDRNDDDAIVWHDSDTPQNDSWPTVLPADIQANPECIEFNLTQGGSFNRYCAMWSFWNKGNWPKALRLQFQVGKPPRPYEVIVDLPN